MKKILIIITKSNWGGAQRYVYDLANNLPKDEYEVVVAAGGEGELMHRLKERNIRTIHLPHLGRDISFINEFWASISLFNIIKIEKPDVIHLNSSKVGGLGSLVGRILGIQRIVFTLHGLAINEDRHPISKFFIKLSYLAIISLAHETIAVSQALKDQVAGMFGFKWPFIESRITMIHNGIGTTSFKEKNIAKEFLATLAPEQKLLEPNRFLIGIIGELHPVKGHKYLLHGFKQFLLTLPIEAAQRPKLIIIGDGEERQNLEQTIKELDLGERTCLAGHVSLASQYLKAFDAFIVPSLSEGLCYVILESGLASLPTIATRVGGIPEMITDSESGLLIDSQSPAAISDALTTIMSNPSMAENLGANLNKKVLEQFSLEKMVTETKKLYL